MNISKIEALYEALQKANNDAKTQEKLVRSFIEEMKAESEKQSTDTVFGEKLTKQKARKISDLLAKICIKLIEHELISEILHYLGQFWPF